MQCAFYNQQQCQSCEYHGISYSQQIAQKDEALKALFNDRMPEQWLPAVTSDETACRNKAKMVVLGAAHAPILGADIQKDGQSEPVSLVDCPLYTEDMQALLAYLQDWIRVSGIPPYNKNKKKGELKYILLTRSAHHGEFMLRFVMRSRDAVTRIENNLERLLTAFPSIKVVSVNLQPVHMARLEGDEEFFLTESHSLIEQFNDVPMVIRPKSFFQTNPKVAAQLYATAREWVREIGPEKMWDLFCGVGGFALHCASEQTAVTGIEIEPEAIASAKRSAEAMGITNLDFDALDSAKFSLMHNSAPELVLVNPPRRGLGKALTEQLVELAPKHIIYSSCNPHTLKADLDGMPNYQAKRLQWFDMFPHTEHAEVMVLLEHKAE
ncbi:23S rRNA (uracil(747)-C(5))-methyltransferase RlmC [Photobacterium aphoticum]|uniref:23S rRNA (uracil(747)-C(5))-methyltransferase RlmC n=1 Tax=Photobacterium aphoticum TaxID=754436 RepID=A0A0J1GFV0_9GAMM|nr:23S rRNA (uracil(747)-C(5))-methyltransferase RlmC [Photobacterium aphoticum]KLU98587.1 23S rRNA methyltransferase [Photobacterium aphoticum]PSU57505.1 23S rRNA (uracil(747)-C(5))-methyltransferase RlmC [Photobacterium aphoticum]GHA62450.1 23S rRNA (uracil(747)-C(5))-methyltransferase RlmC [Photobacterium aphoticum]